jgi:hypothetical protein
MQSGSLYPMGKVGSYSGPLDFRIPHRASVSPKLFPNISRICLLVSSIHASGQQIQRTYRVFFPCSFSYIGLFGISYFWFVWHFILLVCLAFHTSGLIGISYFGLIGISYFWFDWRFILLVCSAFHTSGLIGISYFWFVWHFILLV